MMAKTPRGPNFLVKVSKELIDEAYRRDSSHCMTAMAVKDAQPLAASISVDLQTIRFSLPQRRLRFTYLTPRVCQLALIKWDQGELPEPFEFRLQGAHVTTMWSKKPDTATPRGPMTPAKQAAIAKARIFAPTHQKDDTPDPLARSTLGPQKRSPDHPELTKTTLGAGDHNTDVARRVGGRTPPTTSFAKRRAFGLRALKL
jgi:hypothetical protein